MKKKFISFYPFSAHFYNLANKFKTGVYSRFSQRFSIEKKRFFGLPQLGKNLCFN
jgi:hypothetical protein